MIEKFLLILILLSIFVPLIYFFNGNKNKSRFKKSLLLSSLFFFTLLFLNIFAFKNVISATSEIETAGESFSRGLGFLAASLVTGMSTIGAGIATGSAASAALGAISENEKIMGKALIFVALAEGIAVYGLLISFTILGRI
ncbi:MAG: ATP synthase subunit C [Clostridiales bacterium]|jgi:V/A-type H+-transporting ATPase subunit K|nr:ATP synthase subunit C [Clostridiales bacterium]